MDAHLAAAIKKVNGPGARRTMIVIIVHNYKKAHNAPGIRFLSAIDQTPRWKNFTQEPGGKQAAPC